MPSLFLVMRFSEGSAYKKDTENTRGSGSTEATVSFVRRMSKLISAMTSRCSRDAMRLKSQALSEVENFLSYLNAWEAEVKLGFISKATAEGLLVTLTSTKSILDYITGKFGYKYLLTSRTSQDPLENIFGILQQMTGSNDHPTPTQFLLSANCLSFCGLAKAPGNGNVSRTVIMSLLDKKENPKAAQSKLDQLMDVGCLNEVHELLESCDMLPSHSSIATARSDSRITYYVPRYVARKMLSKTKCEDCSKALLLPAGCEAPKEACLTKEIDKGGLLYLSGDIEAFVAKIEDAFTYCFSHNKLKANSYLDLISCLAQNRINFVGCTQHRQDVTNSLIKFYTLTRLHFLVKAQNRAMLETRQRMHFLKMRRVT